MTVGLLEASEALAAARLKPGRDERAQGAKRGDVGRAFAKEAGAGAERLIGPGGREDFQAFETTVRRVVLQAMGRLSSDLPNADLSDHQGSPCPRLWRYGLRHRSSARDLHHHTG